MTDFENTIKHAVMANHDGELSSLVILMVVKSDKDPEMHMVMSADDLHSMNTATNILKIEILKIIAKSTELKKDRE